MAIKVKEGNKNVRKLARAEINCQFSLNHKENICLKVISNSENYKVGHQQV